MNYINQLVKNQGQEGKECESILGDLNGLHAIANIWDKYPDLIHIVGVNELIKWQQNEFDSKELAAFKAGLAAFPEFFEKCFKEVVENKKELN